MGPPPAVDLIASIPHFRRLAALGAALLSVGIAPAAGATPGLATGFFDDPVLSHGSALGQARALDDVISEGASFVRVNLNWSAVAPAKLPRGIAPTDPANPAYDWTSVDAEIRVLHARGLSVLLNIAKAPAWAEGLHRPRKAQPGSWRPSLSAFAAFARAAALRYDGSFPDPLNPGSSLPRVRYWQGWNEPNLDVWLAPQWQRVHGRLVAVAPGLFRAMTNAFYAAVKRVNSSNTVVLAGTAPYGDQPGGSRTPPVAFDRSLFCLRGAAALKPVRCPHPTHFDVLDHHPYGVGGPLQAAFNTDDVAVPDIHKLTRVLHAAQRAGHVLPRGRKRLWITEISWDSSPPDPQGVPVATQARWLEQSFYVLWRQGVDTVMWYQLVDSPPIPDYASTYQAGLYSLSGAAKPSALAYRFPFVTQRLTGTRILAWGRAPESVTVEVEIFRAGQWKSLRRLPVKANGVYEAALTVRGRATLRARLGSDVSLTWAQRP